jgi:hypothetical protein
MEILLLHETLSIFSTQDQADVLTKTEDNAWARPALLEAKLRRVELAAGQPAVKGRQQGQAYAYNSKEVRDPERAWLEQTEMAYARFSELADQAPERGHGCHNSNTLIEGDVTGLHP